MPLTATIPLEWGRLEYDAGAVGVRIGDRLLPERLRAVFPGADGQPSLEMLLEVVDGIPSCQELTLRRTEGGRDVRTDDLRRIRVETWLENLFSIAALRVTNERETDSGTTAVLKAQDYTEQRETLDAVRKARARARRRLTPELLAEVAEVYRDNVNDRPVEAVRQRFGGEYRTAAKYVERARKEGHLPPTTRGKRQA